MQFSVIKPCLLHFLVVNKSLYIAKLLDKYYAMEISMGHSGTRLVMQRL